MRGIPVDEFIAIPEIEEKVKEIVEEKVEKILNERIKNIVEKRTRDMKTKLLNEMEKKLTTVKREQATEMALKMLKRGFDEQTVAEITGLDIKQVEKLKRSLH